MLLEKFTAQMFLKSAFGDKEKAIDLAHKCAEHYKPFVKQSNTARSRYLSAKSCVFLLKVSSKQAANND